MKIQKLCATGLVAGAILFGAMPSSAHLSPPPHHVAVVPGMRVCPRCDGYRRVPSGFLGLKDKRCPECDGTGVVRVRGYHRPPPPPPPPKHHAKPVPPPKHHAKPAPRPMPQKHGRPSPKKHGMR